MKEGIFKWFRRKPTPTCIECSAEIDSFEQESDSIYFCNFTCLDKHLIDFHNSKESDVENVHE